jgi:predicted transcriptional regulator
VQKNEQKNENKWTFLSNHSHVLLILAQHPALTLREVAHEIGITERAIQRIVADLEEEGYLVKHRQGRQNHYQIYPSKHLRHPIESHCTIGDLIQMIQPADKPTSPDA